MGETNKQDSVGGAGIAALAVSTVGVGYLPLAPGTWGSLVGVAIYFGYAGIVSSIGSNLRFALTAVLLLLIVMIGIWAASKTAEIMGGKDPQIVVVDEVMGQLLAFAFVPFTTGLATLIVGFVLFRLFDIVKPYPVKQFEQLPGGIGICADDLVAGVYAGVLLAVLKIVFSF